MGGKKSLVSASRLVGDRRPATWRSQMSFRRWITDNRRSPLRAGLKPPTSRAFFITFPRCRICRLNPRSCPRSTSHKRFSIHQVVLRGGFPLSYLFLFWLKSASGGIFLLVGGKMEENVGLVKVIIVQGRKLAIRDFTSSDPYVVVRVGNQTAKTKVIKSCLNPVWNEEMTFSTSEPLGVLKLEVFDRDRFKSDDKMGHAFLDLRPLASASKLKQALQLTTGETMLRKVAANSDNCLLADTCVTYVNGEIVLDARLKLRDVESGELYVTVKWIDHPTTTPVEKAR